MTMFGWVLLATPLALVVSGAIALSVIDERERAEWQQFVDQNGCHVVEIEEAQTNTSFGPGIGFDGKVTLIQQTHHKPARECWLCSNGIRYWKTAGMAVDRLQGGAK